MKRRDRSVVRSQKGLKWWNDLARDVLSDATQRHQHIAPFSGGIAEGYIGGHFDIHLHARAVLRVHKHIAGDLCIVFRCVNDRREFHQF